MASPSPQQTPTLTRHFEQSALSVSLLRGGLIYRLESRLGLVAPDCWNPVRRILVVVTLTCIPLIALAFGGTLQAGTQLLKDYRLIARFLVALPLFIISQRTIDIRFRSAIEHFFNARIVRQQDMPRFLRIVTRTKRLADSIVPELILLALVFFVAPMLQQTRFLIGTSWGMNVIPGSAASLTKAGWYFLLVTEPIYLMLFSVLIWKWIVWITFLWQVSRFELQLTCAHPDRCGGLGFLGLVPQGFLGPVFGASAAVGAVWRFDLSNKLNTLQSYYIPAITLLAGVLFILYGPLAFFSLRLFELRRTGLLNFAALAQINSAQFVRKWITDLRKNEAELPYIPEVATLYNLGAEFRIMNGAHFVPIHQHSILQISAAVLIPLLPLLLTEIPLETLLKNVFRALL